NLSEITKIEKTNYIEFQLLIDSFKDFNKEVIICQKLMHECNKVLQKSINESTCNKGTLKILEEFLNDFKKQISIFLKPIFEITNSINNVIVFINKKTDKSLFRKSVEIDLKNWEVPELFNVSFESAYQKKMV